MATKTQGLLIGCSMVIAGIVILIFVTSLLFSGPWFGTDFAVSTGDGVGLVVLEGPINGSRSLVEEIEANRTDPAVRAVVLQVNSPGGEVAPSQEIYEALRRLAREKPLIASVSGMAASGAFYAAIAADTIFADPGSLVGSIGVIFMYPTASELLEKVGVEMQVYKSGRLKDMGSFARAPTEEEEEVFDSLVADVFDQFVDAVAEERDLERDRVLSMADGRVFTGRQARDVGLVDRLGDLHAATDLAGSLAGLSPDAPLIRKRRPRIPMFDLLEELFRDNSRASWGPRLEYRFR